MQGDAQALPQGIIVFTPAPAEDFNVPGGGRQKAFQNFDRRCLAGPIGPEQAEAFAGLHLEIQTVDGIHRSRAAGIAFPQVTAQDSGFHAQIIRNGP